VGCSLSKEGAYMKFLVDWHKVPCGSRGTSVRLDLGEVFEVEGDSPAKAGKAALKVARAKIKEYSKKGAGRFVPRITMLIDENGKVYEKVDEKRAGGKTVKVWRLKKE